MRPTDTNKHMVGRQPRRLIALSLVVLVLGSGCGSDDFAQSGELATSTSLSTTTTKPVEITTTPVSPTTSSTTGALTATSTLASTTTFPVRPSQSVGDALRDGIVPELAALPIELRVVQYPEYFGATRIESAEGVWMISTPDSEIPGVEGCGLGDPSGVYGRDVICVAEYGEILLLDADTSEILRAYPFPAVNPQALLITDNALYCIRQGDGALPDSMLCRIDRTSLEVSVRVFPWHTHSAFEPETELYVPAHWTIATPTDLILWEGISHTDDGLHIAGYSGTARIDPATLALIEVTADT